jgi:23S rRNA (cytidine1920-2'-O)/16S rRNA (cytidine1409-2'-O)-methyltransferase
VVRDPALHQEVCDRIRACFERQPGWSVLDVVESPVLGPEGNKEFLIAARKKAA